MQIRSQSVPVVQLQAKASHDAIAKCCKPVHSILHPKVLFAGVQVGIDVGIKEGCGRFCCSSALNVNIEAGGGLSDAVL